MRPTAPTCPCACSTSTPLFATTWRSTTGPTTRPAASSRSPASGGRRRESAIKENTRQSLHHLNNRREIGMAGSLPALYHAWKRCAIPSTPPAQAAGPAERCYEQKHQDEPYRSHRSLLFPTTQKQEAYTGRNQSPNRRGARWKSAPRRHQGHLKTLPASHPQAPHSCRTSGTPTVAITTPTARYDSPCA